MAKEVDPNAPLVINCSEIEGFKQYTGRFVFKRPTVKDTIAIAVKNAQLTQSTEISTAFANMAWVLATLSIVLVEKPKTIDFETLYDMAPVYDLYDKYSQWVDSFRSVVSNEQEATS